MKGFKNYNKTELFNTIDKISIEKVGSQVVTKFDNRVINTSNVSNRYEIFDIVKYLKDKIELIEKNFTITKYFKLNFKRLVCLGKYFFSGKNNFKCY